MQCEIDAEAIAIAVDRMINLRRRSLLAFPGFLLGIDIDQRTQRLVTVLDDRAFGQHAQSQANERFDMTPPPLSAACRAFAIPRNASSTAI